MSRSCAGVKSRLSAFSATSYQAYGGAESVYRPSRWDYFREDHRFTGKEEDVEVGLAYFGKRYYAPLLGRWRYGTSVTAVR